MHESISKMMSTRKSFVQIEQSCCVLNVIIHFEFAAVELKCHALEQMKRNEMKCESQFAKNNIHHCVALRRNIICAWDSRKGIKSLSQLLLRLHEMYFILFQRFGLRSRSLFSRTHKFNALSIDTVGRTVQSAQTYVATLYSTDNISINVKTHQRSAPTAPRLTMTLLLYLFFVRFE